MPRRPTPWSSLTASELEDAELGELALSRGLLDGRALAAARRRGSLVAELASRVGAEAASGLVARARAAVTRCPECQAAWVRAGRPASATCVGCGASADTTTMSEPELPTSASTPLVETPDVPPEPSTLARPLREGDTVGGWTIDRQIGRGGMGVVYAARRGRQHAALKVMAPGLSARSRERFLREGAAARRLEHPAIAKVLEHGTSEHGPWIAMELVEGGSLGELIRREPVPVARALELAERIARAVDHAHRRGIVHRDLKPANVLVGRDGGVKVVDFGLARDLEGGDARITSDGQPVGTPGYMAPEQVEARSPDAVGVAADVHAVGTVLYELVTGSRPFRGRTRREVFDSIVRDAVEPITKRSPGRAFPAGLEEVLLRALAKRPADRYLTARELADDVAALRRGHYPQHVSEVTRTTDPALALHWGDRIGPYEVRYPVGVGAAAVVFKAAAEDGSAVALKVLRARDRERLRRFEREVRLLARLASEGPGFVPLLSHGSTAEGTWLAMPFLPRGTLRDRLERGPLGVEAGVSVVRLVASALSRAHAQGITHRDLKPENILFTEEDEPLVADLGLARPARDAIAEWSDSITVSREGRFLGTAGYAAPEQLDDARQAGPPADVFALGAVLYECASGVPPFEAPNAIVLTARLAAATHAPLGDVARDAPAWLCAVVERALDRDPAKRYADGAALVAALDARREAGEAPGLARKAFESVKKLATGRRRRSEKKESP